MKQMFALFVASALLAAPALAKTHTAATAAPHHMMMKSHHMMMKGHHGKMSGKKSHWTKKHA